MSVATPMGVLPGSVCASSPGLVPDRVPLIPGNDQTRHLAWAVLRQLRPAHPLGLHPGGVAVLQPPSLADMLVGRQNAVRLDCRAVLFLFGVHASSPRCPGHTLAQIPGHRRGVPGDHWGAALRPSQLRATASDGRPHGVDAKGLSAGYGALSMPVAIVAGNGDKVVSPDHAERLRGRSRRARCGSWRAPGTWSTTSPWNRYPYESLESVREISGLI